MTNDEGSPNDEGPNHVEAVAQLFVIRALSLFRHSSLVLRHFSTIISKSGGPCLVCWELKFCLGFGAWDLELLGEHDEH